MSIPPAQDAPPVGRTASPNRVLVVDDEAAIRAFVAAALEELSGQA